MIDNPSKFRWLVERLLVGTLRLVLFLAIMVVLSQLLKAGGCFDAPAQTAKKTIRQSEKVENQ